MPKLETLRCGFLSSAEKFPQRPALVVADETLTYQELHHKAAAIAATLLKKIPLGSPPLVAVFAYRSVTAFAGILGTLLRGHGYVPLNRTYPVDRTRAMLERSECQAVIVDAESAAQLEALLAGIKRKLLILLPEQQDATPLRELYPQHEFVTADELESPKRFALPSLSADATAYLLFTSGSTGVPKGVMVSHANAAHYVNFIADRFAITENDRFSQNFDLTFDLSVADMFVAWARGACVCCPSGKTKLSPGRFVTDANLTIWFSVPSTGLFMKRLGALKPGMYPNLRVSMFCGEALPVELVKAWADAAPNSVIENLYGPTELTIACTSYRWKGSDSEKEAEGGLVPIGEAFDGMLPLVVNESLHEVEAGQTGELLMAGPQVAQGYWHDPEKTARAFVTPPGKSQTYYRTGDRVRKPIDGKPMQFLGRVDNQIKILGHRVELSEIEAVVREESGVETVIAVGWPRTASGAGGVEVFLQDQKCDIDIAELRRKVASRLPSFMVPRQIHLVTEFPLSSNGKVDRAALIKILEASS